MTEFQKSISEWNTFRRIRLTLDMATDLVNGQYGHDEKGIPLDEELEKKFWKHLEDAYGYYPDTDVEFQAWAIKATQTEIIGAALAHVLSPRMAPVAWHDTPWTEDEAREAYGEYLGQLSKSDLIEEMVTTMTHMELLEWNINEAEYMQDGRDENEDE